MEMGRKGFPWDREGGRKLCPRGGEWGNQGRGRGWEETIVHSPARCACPAEKEADVYMPLWFEKRLDPLTGETACMYKGGYWEAKERQDWHMCPNIF